MLIAYKQLIIWVAINGTGWGIRFSEYDQISFYSGVRKRGTEAWGTQGYSHKVDNAIQEVNLYTPDNVLSEEQGEEHFSSGLSSTWEFINIK